MIENVYDFVTGLQDGAAYIRHNEIVSTRMDMIGKRLLNQKTYPFYNVGFGVGFAHPTRTAWDWKG